MYFVEPVLLNYKDILIVACFQGDEADGMYFVESGSVNITLTDSDATEREVSCCKAGSYLGMQWLEPTQKVK